MAPKRALMLSPKDMVDIASGTLTRGETINYSDPTEIYTLDPPF